jgi:hypothetical protein
MVVGKLLGTEHRQFTGKRRHMGSMVEDEATEKDAKVSGAFTVSVRYWNFHSDSLRIMTRRGEKERNTEYGVGRRCR